ncbi:MAG: hypothetical protein WEE20_09640 [Bacteroidota bacterium]
MMRDAWYEIGYRSSNHDHEECGERYRAVDEGAGEEEERTTASPMGR